MGDRNFGYKQLVGWQKADELAHKVYDLTLSFPKAEQFGITSQLQRSILSAPTNIVEGYSRSGKNEFHRFLSISLGSLAEAGYLLEFACKRQLISQEEFLEINLLREEVGRILWKLFTSQS